MPYNPPGFYSGSPDRVLQQRGGPPAGPGTEKLSKVQASLSALGRTLKHDVDSKKELEQQRMYEVQQLGQKLEQKLTQECDRRATCDQELQGKLEKQISDALEKQKRFFQDRFTQQQLNVDTLTKKVSSLEKELVGERERNGQLQQRLDEGIAQVRQLQSYMEQDRIHQKEKEAQLLRKCAEDIHRLQGRLDSEVHARELANESLREAVGRLGQEKTKDDDRFKALVLGDIETLKQAVRLETEEREQMDDQLVATMDQMIHQVQDALKVVVK
eukprot:Hpha_TRINITY_DN16821_c1_g6::TRINITY_DN16821_c1_g6_i1::g.153771::m.153771